MRLVVAGRIGHGAGEAAYHGAVEDVGYHSNPVKITVSVSQNNSGVNNAGVMRVPLTRFRNPCGMRSLYKSTALRYARTRT